MKKLLLLFLSLFMVVSFCLVFAAEKSSEKVSSISDKNTILLTENQILNDEENEEKTNDAVNIGKGEIHVGETAHITVDKAAKFTSSDISVVTVDKDGNVTAIGEGVANVFIDYGDTYEKFEFTVKEIPNFEVTIPDFLEIGKTEQITIKAEQNFTAEYSSSNPEIIKVNENGAVTVLKKEKANIEVKLTFEDGLNAIQIIEVEPSNIIDKNAEQSHGLCVIIIVLSIITTIASNFAIYHYMKKDDETEV